MPKDHWVCNGQLLDLSHAPLGRLALSLTSPWQDYHDPAVPMETIAPHIVRDFTESQSVGWGFNWSFSFSRFFTAGRSRSKTHTTTISAPICTSLFLPNSMEYFSHCCRQPKTQEWLGEMMERRIPVYMVVGVKVVRNAKVEVSHSGERGKTGRCSVPVGRALSGGLDGGALDCDVEIGVEKNFDVGTNYVVEGEKVYAVQYRKIEFGSFINKSVEKARLQAGNVWATYIGTRGSRKTEVFVEARLGEQADIHALDIEATCTRIVLASSEELLLVDRTVPGMTFSSTGANSSPGSVPTSAT